MASGIVVRTIAPHITDKYTDPAVVVVDDVGTFCYQSSFPGMRVEQTI